MITGINESKILTKHVSYKCEYKLHSRKCSWNQIWNNNKYQYVCKNLKNIVHGKKYYIWNLATCSCENGKYLASIIDNSVIMCDEIIHAVAKSYNEKTKSVPTNFNEER